MMTVAPSRDGFLGGPSLDRVRMIEAGLPASALQGIVDGDAITLIDPSGIVASARTLRRRMVDNRRLSLRQSDRLAHFADVLALATRVLGKRHEAMAWFRRPQAEFDGMVPLTLMKTHFGCSAVMQRLNRMKLGMIV